MGTAFCPGAGLGLYQFCRMPFGLTNAPSTFQRMMDKLFRGLTFVSTYIDDVLVHSRNEEEHKVHLQEVFRILRKAGLTLHGRKCHIGLSEVTYLGHGKGMTPDPCKIHVVKEWPVPNSVEEVRRFHYRHYIHQFADLASPLHQLTRKGQSFNWTDNCQNSFESLKSKLVEAPILAYPQLQEGASEFVLMTDASSLGLSAVMEQDGHVVAYASRTLSQSEKQYSVIQKECLAIVYATKQFRHYLLGRPFKVLTDHAPLQWFSAQKMEGMLCRWSLALQEFNFRVCYRPGSHNGNADALSRIPQPCCTTSIDTASRLQEDIIAGQQQVPTLSLLYRALTAGTKRRPVTKDATLHCYCQLWPQLRMINGVICRRYSPDPSLDPVTVPIIPPGQ